MTLPSIRDAGAAGQGGAGFAACTIVSRNYLAQARVLIDSFFLQEPQGRFYALVVDDLPPGAKLPPEVRVVVPGELEIGYLRELCFKYEVTELCTALKPNLLAFLLRDVGERIVVYLDPDIWVASPLDGIRRAIEDSEIVLTPHVLSLLPEDGCHPTRAEMQSVGEFNLGFLGVRNTAETLRFLDWWSERLRDGCRRDPAKGFFVDQKWIDQVPGLFPSHGILRDPTCNVAYWNLYERSVEKRGGRFFVNGQPLTFFHFSNVDLRERAFRRTHWNRENLVEGSATSELIDLYADLVEAAGHASTSRWEYGFARFDNGLSISLPMRELYRTLEPGRREEFGDPFDSRRPDSFFGWATSPDPVSGLSPFLLEVFELRTDLVAAFPDVRGSDRAPFLEWAATSGAREMAYEPEFVRRGSTVISPRASDGGSLANLALFEVLAISPVSSDPAALSGSSLDFPRVGDACDPRAVDFEGWVIGATEAVIAVEGDVAGQCRGRSGVGHPRHDVAAAFPEISGSKRSGFSLSVNAQGLREGELRLHAILSGGRRIAFSEVRGRLGWRHRAELEEAPLVSVVLASLANSPGTDEALSNVLAQEYPHLEVVVAGGGIDSARLAVAAEFGVRFLGRTARTFAEAFNEGLRETTGEFLLFLMPTTRLLSNAVAAGLRSFREHSEPALFLGHAPAPSPFCATAGSTEPLGIGVPDARLAGALFRRAAVEFAGNFDRTKHADAAHDLCRRIAAVFPLGCHHEIVAEVFDTETATRPRRRAAFSRVRRTAGSATKRGQRHPAA